MERLGTPHTTRLVEAEAPNSAGIARLRSAAAVFINNMHRCLGVHNGEQYTKETHHFKYHNGWELQVLQDCSREK